MFAKTEVDLAALVDQIRAEDQAGIEQLYGMFEKGAKYFIARQLGEDSLDDMLQECFMGVIRSIKRGYLTDPNKLMGYARGVVQRRVAKRVNQLARERRRNGELDEPILATLTDGRHDAERDMIQRERVELMKKALESLPSNYREVLVRFYLREQSPDQIKKEMGINDDQYRLMKNRAKDRLAAKTMAAAA